MSAPNKFDIFKLINSHTLDELSCEARMEVSDCKYRLLPDEEIIFMREILIRKELNLGNSQQTKQQGPKHKKNPKPKDVGPFHHFCHLLMFIKNSSGKIRIRYSTRQYKDNVIGEYWPYCLELGIIEDELRALKRAIK
jgi:hypothetical protein